MLWDFLVKVLGFEVLQTYATKVEGESKNRGRSMSVRALIFQNSYNAFNSCYIYTTLSKEAPPSYMRQRQLSLPLMDNMEETKQEIR